jgi:hypothetical protein
MCLGQDRGYANGLRIFDRETHRSIPIAELMRSRSVSERSASSWQQIDPCAGEFEGAATEIALRFPQRAFRSRQHPALQRGDWGSEPPDPGSALTNKIRNYQVFIVYRLAYYKQLSTSLSPN